MDESMTPDTGKIGGIALTSRRYSQTGEGGNCMSRKGHTWVTLGHKVNKQGAMRGRLCSYSKVRLPSLSQRRIRVDCLNNFMGLQGSESH